MTFIDPESAVRMNIVRLVTTQDIDGNVTGEAYNEVFGEHWADVQPLSDSDRLANAQLKISATHKIFPELRITGVLDNDFYREVTNGKLYRIVESFDFKTLNYFKVWEGAFGDSGAAQTVQEVRYTVTNVGPGIYTFGQGLFLSVPTFTTAPAVYGVASNDSDFHIEQITTTGFRLIDDGGAETPIVTVQIFGN